MRVSSCLLGYPVWPSVKMTRACAYYCSQKLVLLFGYCPVWGALAYDHLRHTLSWQMPSVNSHSFKSSVLGVFFPPDVIFLPIFLANKDPVLFRCCYNFFYLQLCAFLINQVTFYIFVYINLERSVIIIILSHLSQCTFNVFFFFLFFLMYSLIDFKNFPTVVICCIKLIPRCFIIFADIIDAIIFSNLLLLE